MLLAPSSHPLHPAQESSTEGLAEPAWEATGKVHNSDPSRLVKTPHERPSGRGLFRLSQSCVQPPSSSRWDLSPPGSGTLTHSQYSSVQPFGRPSSPQATNPIPTLG